MGIGNAELEIVAAAKAAFAEYAAMDAPELPENPISALQVRLCRWQSRNFGASSKLEQLAGVTEENGELAEVVSSLATKALAAAAGLSESLAKMADLSKGVGQLAHTVLKEQQKIRGFADPEFARAAAGDAIADQFVYLFQMCTMFRLDAGTLLFGIAEHVMRRDWAADPEGGAG